MMRKLSRVMIILFSAAVLSACAPVKLPDVSKYTISGLKKSKPRKSRYQTNQTIMVSLPVANPGYESDRMVYVTVPYRLRSYTQNQWVAPPANMLLPLLAEQLRDTHHFKAVVVSPFAGVTNYRLVTQILVLQQEFLQPISKVRLVMQATLLNDMTNRVIASRHFQDIETAPGNNPYSGVLAINLAAAKVSQNIANFVLKNT